MIHVDAMMIVIREAVPSSSNRRWVGKGSTGREEVTVSAVIRSDIVARWTPNLNLI